MTVKTYTTAYSLYLLMPMYLIRHYWLLKFKCTFLCTLLTIGGFFFFFVFKLIFLIVAFEYLSTSQIENNFLKVCYIFSLKLKSLLNNGDSALLSNNYILNSVLNSLHTSVVSNFETIFVYVRLKYCHIVAYCTAGNTGVYPVGCSFTKQLFKCLIIFIMNSEKV